MTAIRTSTAFGHNKFNAKAVEVGLKRFASKKEAKRWEYLSALQDAGEIFGLTTQVHFELIPAQTKKNGRTERKCEYIADFVYSKFVPGENGRSVIVVEDVKGLRKGAAYQLFVIKRKLMLQRYGIEVVEV